MNHSGFVPQVSGAKTGSGFNSGDLQQELLTSTRGGAGREKKLCKFLSAGT
jgi:hypothetical protein